MATSTFNLDLVDIFDEAYLRASGGARSMRSGNDYRTARRSLNLMMMEWANRGINLWTVEEGTIALVAGEDSYNLPNDTVDLIEYALRSDDGTQNQSDIAISRMSVSTYASIPNKNTRGRPTQIYINRATTTPIVTVWPIPNTSYTLAYWRLRRIQDAGSTGAANVDVPFRFLPALIAGMAFFIAQIIPEGGERAVLLKQAYDAAFDEAASEDRDRATLRIVPRIYV